MLNYFPELLKERHLRWCRGAHQCSNRRKGLILPLHRCRISVVNQWPKRHLWSLRTQYSPAKLLAKLSSTLLLKVDHKFNLSLINTLSWSNLMTFKARMLNLTVRFVCMWKCSMYVMTLFLHWHITAYGADTFIENSSFHSLADSSKMSSDKMLLIKAALGKVNIKTLRYLLQSDWRE